MSAQNVVLEERIDAAENKEDGAAERGRIVSTADDQITRILIAFGSHNGVCRWT